MQWNSAKQRMMWCLCAAGLWLPAVTDRAEADAVGAWREDPRRPAAALTDAAAPLGADPWHVDMRRPAPSVVDNASVSAADPWAMDPRRPDALRGGTDDSNVEPWRIDDRRPAPWPSDELQVEAEVLDDDNDGVPNEKDRCPDTPVGTRVDRNGCPMSVKESELLDTGTLRLENVYFDTEKSTIKPESYDVLNEVGEILEKWPELRIEIGGHTDDTGTEAFNRDLSQARAGAVREYLTSKFSLERSQYTSKGYGEDRPVASNDTSEGRARNRRVEFTVLNREVLRK